jgi:heme A synthase
MTTPHSGARSVAARFSVPVLRQTRDSVRGLALASVIANAVLVCTGAAVRLSSSGLGCPHWPRCATTSAVAAHSAGQTPLNTAIGFGNRLLTFPLAVIAALTFIGALAVALAIGLAIGLHFAGAPARSVRASRILLDGLAVQGAIGYAQYSSHLPAGLVWVHVSMSLVLRRYLPTRGRQPLAAAHAGPAPAARNLQAPGVTLGAEEGVR